MQDHTEFLIGASQEQLYALVAIVVVFAFMYIRLVILIKRLRELLKKHHPAMEEFLFPVSLHNFSVNPGRLGWTRMIDVTVIYRSEWKKVSNRNIQRCLQAARGTVKWGLFAIAALFASIYFLPAPAQIDLEKTTEPAIESGLQPD